MKKTNMMLSKTVLNVENVDFLLALLRKSVHFRANFDANQHKLIRSDRRRFTNCTLVDTIDILSFDRQPIMFSCFTVFTSAVFRLN